MATLRTIFIGMLLCLTAWVSPATAALQNHSHADLKGQNTSTTSLVDEIFPFAEMHDANFSSTRFTRDLASNR